MRAGPKAQITAPPLDLSELPEAGAERVIAFCETFLYVPKGTGARQRLRLRPWQQDIIRALFDDPRPRQGLLSLPRGNGKSTLAAAIGLYGLFADRVEGAQVLCVASDERQARIVFNTARRMVELEPLLLEQTQIFQNRLYVPETDSTLYPLPAEPGALQGYDPSLAIVDELHVVTESVWEAVSLASGKRDRSLVLAISTPAGDPDSIMRRLVDHGRAGDDPAFFFREFTAPTGCDLTDEEAWATANPALDDFLHRDALRATLKTSREASFRRYRLGQWVQDDRAWMPRSAWQACASPGRTIADGSRVILGFDGSFNGDATALAVCAIDDVPHLDVVQLWERPYGVAPGWQVPIVDVEEAIRAACRRWQVAEIVCDPFRWARTYQVLEAEGLPIIEYPQTPARMTPATTRFYEAVMNGTVTHSGDPDLERHVCNAVIKTDARGTRIAKEHRDSGRKIDLAICCVMAYDRAAVAEANTPMLLLV